MRATFVENGLHQALYIYQENQGNLPRKIIIYRDAIGGPSMHKRCENYEVKYIIDAIERNKERKKRKKTNERTH